MWHLPSGSGCQFPKAVVSLVVHSAFVRRSIPGRKHNGSRAFGLVRARRGFVCGYQVCDDALYARIGTRTCTKSGRHDGSLRPVIVDTRPQRPIGKEPCTRSLPEAMY